jgi:hypothetical protein
MSNAGTFILITNDGRQDRLITATDFLTQRLAQVRAQRASEGKSGAEAEPTLKDIERTHFLFMNAHFKPHVALAFEYSKVSVQSGTASFGSRVQFNIPMFGDFFADMALYVTWSAPTFTPQSAANAGTWRYADYMGERLMDNVSFDVNGNPLDAYTYRDYAFYRQFRLNVNKRTAWNRCVGHDDISSAKVVNAYNVEGGAALLAAQDSRLAASTAALVTNPRTYLFNINIGNQSDQATHTASVELIVPLLFWFCLDPRLAVPSVSIPYGMRFITIDLAAWTKLAGINQGAGTTNALATPTISTCQLYINNLFVNYDIHNIYIARIGFTLIRVFRTQQTQLNRASDSILLSNLKWPIEFMFVGVQPTANTDVSTSDATRLKAQRAWWQHRVVTTTTAVSNGVTTTGEVFYGVWGTQGNASDVNVSLLNLLYDAYTDTVDSLTLRIHGVNIYNSFTKRFFNAYVPLTYGGPNITAPEDNGMMMINFCLYPGTYQPSGHINISRAREIYIDYVSSWVSSTNTAYLNLSASAINFLLISDGSAVLRYTT